MTEMQKTMERRSVLRGALTLPVLAAFTPLGGTPAPTGATTTSSPRRSGVLRRTWDVETLDRRVHKRSELA